MVTRQYLDEQTILREKRKKTKVNLPDVVANFFINTFLPTGNLIKKNVTQRVYTNKLLNESITLSENQPAEVPGKL